MQNRFLPRSFSAVPRLDYYADSHTTGPICTDFFDFIPLGGRSLAIALGSISDKSVASALLLAGMQSTLRHLAAVPTAGLANTVRALNRLVCDLSSQYSFATLFYAQIDPALRTLRYVNAGSETALLVRNADQRIHRLETTGTVLGLSDCSQFAERTVLMEPGDLLVSVSDGVTDARNREAFDFTAAGVTRVVFERDGAEAVELVEEILSAVDRFASHAPQSQDRTVLVTRLIEAAGQSVALREEQELVCAAG
jgi:sigma-B regulation protein RsbU (phosphoserine phosphatase)